jgi:hypothetical protein
MAAGFGASQEGESETSRSTPSALSGLDSSELLSLVIFLCSSKESNSPQAKPLYAR